MSELDVHLAAAYLKRVSLSSTLPAERLEEESTRKLRRVSSSNNSRRAKNVGSTGVRFDGSPKGKEHGRRRGADDMRRVVSADDMRRAAPGAAPDETLPTVSDDSNTSVPVEPAADDGGPGCLAGAPGRTARLGPVEWGRCSELADATDEFVRRGLFDAPRPLSTEMCERARGAGRCT